MNAQFTISGLTFDMQGDGFGRNEGDFDQIVQATSDALYDLSAGELRRLHDGSIMDEEESDFIDRAAFDALNTIAYHASKPVLTGWHNTENVFVTICGCP